VTQKPCFALAELDGGAVLGADSTKLSCDDDHVDHSCEKDTRGGRGELSSFVTQNSIDEVQHLTSNIQTRSYPTQRVEALQDPNRSRGHPGGDHGICSLVYKPVCTKLSIIFPTLSFMEYCLGMIRQRNMKENEEFEGIIIGC